MVLTLSTEYRGWYLVRYFPAKIEAYSDDVYSDQPVLLQILNGNTNPAPAGSIYSLPGNSIIEISMPGGFPVSFLCIVAEFAFSLAA